MPSVRAQRVNKDEIYIQASDGREVLITRAQVLAFFRAQSGNRNSRIVATIEWVKQQIGDAFSLVAGDDGVKATLISPGHVSRFLFNDQDVDAAMELELTD